MILTIVLPDLDSMFLRTHMVSIIVILMKPRNLHRQLWMVLGILQQLFRHLALTVITVPRLSGHLTVWSLVSQEPTLTTIPLRLRPAHRVKPSACSAQQVCSALQVLKRLQEQLIKEVSTHWTTRVINRSTIARVVLTLQRETQRDHSLSALSAPPVLTARTAQRPQLHALSTPSVPLAAPYSLTVPWTIWMSTRAVTLWLTARHVLPITCVPGALSRLHVPPALPAHGILIILSMTLAPWYANRLKLGVSALRQLLTVKHAQMASIVVSMLRHALTAQRAPIVLVVLSTHALPASTAPQARAQHNLAQQVWSAVQTVKTASCFAPQAPIARPVQANRLLSHQLMLTITTSRERQLTPKTNVAMAISVLGARRVPMTRLAPQTLYHCLEKLNANSALLESGVLLGQASNLTALLVSFVTVLILTPQSVLKGHLEEQRIFRE